MPDHNRATDMNDSGVAMGKLGGMIITSDTGGFFGTEWDDQPIRPENFHEIKAMPDADIPESAKITSQKPEVPADMVLQEMPEELEDISEKPEDTSLTKVPDDSLSIEPSANIPAQGTSDNKPGQSHPISQIILLKIPIVLKMPSILSRKEMQKTEKPLPNFPPSPMAN